jgi:acetoin utilization protein AcuC
MSGQVVVTYHPLYDGRGFSPLSASWSRYRRAMDLMRSLGILDAVEVKCPPLAEDQDVLRCHSQAHLDAILEGDAAGRGTFATSDTPAWHGILGRARAAVGGTLLAARLVASQELTHVFNPGGGLHHAMREQARGFCPFNDLAIAADLLASLGRPRLAIIDIDSHHGDGTQELLYDREVLKISLHQYDGRYFPGTGSTAEVGWGHGHGLSINVPLPQSVGEAAYLDAFRDIVPSAVRAFAPDVMLVNFGVDGHYTDRLSRLGLGTCAYRALAAACHSLAHEVCAGRLIITGSGGYNPDAVASCWAVLIATLTGQLEVPPGVSDAMTDSRRDHRRSIATEVLGSLKEAHAWPGFFSLLKDDPPLPDGRSASACQSVIEDVIRNVLPLRLINRANAPRTVVADEVGHVEHAPPPPRDGEV